MICICVFLEMLSHLKTSQHFDLVKNLLVLGTKLYVFFLFTPGFSFCLEMVGFLTSSFDKTNLFAYSWEGGGWGWGAQTWRFSKSGKETREV